ncbi:MAG: OmpA family protein [Balneolaceae bacterium]|nr:MAG: OmpA family protein [Balneolaceae bacterium]
MNITVNKFSFIIFFLSLGILFSSCRTAEEIVEPEPEPTVVEEPVEEEDWTVEEEVVEEVAVIEELYTINFGFDMYNITDRAARLLAENVAKLRENPATRVRVDAFTDHVGGDQYNLRLSLRRAAAVVDFYVQNGIDDARIDSRGLGKAPIPCTEAEMDRDTPGCEKNRRAESHPLN